MTSRGRTSRSRQSSAGQPICCSNRSEMKYCDSSPLPAFYQSERSRRSSIMRAAFLLRIAMGVLSVLLGVGPGWSQARDPKPDLEKILSQLENGNVGTRRQGLL